MAKTRIKDFQINSGRLDSISEQMEQIDMLGEGNSVYCMNPDENGIYTRLEWRRADGSLYRVSELTDGESPMYTTRTVTYYEADGTTVRSQFVYALYYDEASGELIDEVVVSG